MIWTPYFFPPIAIREALRIAVKKGVKVEILVPRFTDSWFITKAMQNYLVNCVNDGISVYKSHPPFDHTKVIIVDDWVSVGSSNFDFRSLFISYEANFDIINNDFAKKMRTHFDHQKKKAVKFDKTKLPITQRVLSNTCGLFSSIY